jgi:hypothetical protein
MTETKVKPRKNSIWNGTAAISKKYIEDATPNRQ